jgi:hypothetical protein
MFAHDPLRPFDICCQIVTQIPEWRTKPILILGNKIDLIATAVTEIQLQEALCLSGITSNTLNIKLQMCSIVRRVGYSSGTLETLVFTLPCCYSFFWTI